MELVDIFNKNGGFFRTKDLASRNQWIQLNEMIAEGVVLKLKSGLYCLRQCSVTGRDMEVFRVVPSGVFCMFSAWRHYDLVSENPFEHHVAVDINSRIPLPNYPPIRLYRWNEKYYQLGTVETAEGIKIYDMEKSVCDALRFRKMLGQDVVIEVLRNYAERDDRNFDKLTDYARLMRIEHIMLDVIEPVL
jgi:predicted transcriptional regulator of viral defense system